jgi:hypothetical protein
MSETLARPTDTPRNQRREPPTPAELAAARASMARAERDEHDPTCRARLRQHQVAYLEILREQTSCRYRREAPRVRAATRRAISDTRRSIVRLDRELARHSRCDAAAPLRRARTRSTHRTTRSRRSPTASRAPGDPDPEPPSDRRCLRCDVFAERVLQETRGAI